MIESRLHTSGRTTIPPAVREALGLKPGDLLCYAIEDGRVVLSRDEHGPDDMVSDEELAPIIASALADETGETYSADEVFAELHARIDVLSGRKDAA